MFKRIKTWLADKKIRLNNNIDNPLPSPKKDLTEEVQQKKQVMSQIQTCSMAQHGPSCDIFNCSGSCFVRVADKIVGKPKTVRMKQIKSIDMGKYGK